MSMTIAEIVEKIGGILEGDGTVAVTGLAGINDAGSGDVTFLSNPRYASAAAQTEAAAIIVNEDFKGECSCAVIRVKNADKAFAGLAALFAPEPVKYKPGIHQTAVISKENVELGKDVSIGPHCVIEENVTIGDRTVLCAGCYIGRNTVVGSECRFYPHVSVRDHAKTGDRVIIHNGAVIGSDGFGYVQEKGEWKKIPQIGIVEIGNDVEIGANVTIDRARFGKTVIGNGVKIDNLVQIAHNVQIGDNTAMAAQVGISGSSIVGHNVQLGGQAGVAGHLTIGDNSVVGAQAGVTKDVQAKTFVSGYPAMPHGKARKMHAHVMRLPELKKRIKELEQRITELENKEGKN
ncbi:UDP-3-O-(3-hydroxymyristoyl)glucosamine N-acyltransferase [Verrucomicrobiota bacterium]